MTEDVETFEDVNVGMTDDVETFEDVSVGKILLEDDFEVVHEVVVNGLELVVTGFDEVKVGAMLVEVIIDELLV